MDRCRPFFCCILGERYGWYANPNKPDPLLDLTFQKAAANYPWVTKYLDLFLFFSPFFRYKSMVENDSFTDRSVTELEVLHAVLNEQQNKSSAYFYFKGDKIFVVLLITLLTCTRSHYFFKKRTSKS